MVAILRQDPLVYGHVRQGSRVGAHGIVCAVVDETPLARLPAR